jgi:hypothetical protein
MHVTSKLMEMVSQAEGTEEGRRLAKEKRIDDLIDSHRFRPSIEPFKQDRKIFSIAWLLYIAFVLFAFSRWAPPLRSDDEAGFMFAVITLGIVISGFQFLINKDISSWLKRYLRTVQTLLVEICEKPFEVRTEWAMVNNKPDYSKVKVIIEENLLINGSHVIKEKSRHITAYIDITQSDESILGMLVALAKEAENKFK